MNTEQAFTMGENNRNKEPMVFDWVKCAQLIIARKPKKVGAGLKADWEWTGGTIYRDGEIVEDVSVFLLSTWATPEIEIDGVKEDCFVMQSEHPKWGSGTYFPDEAMQILEDE